MPISHEVTKISKAIEATRIATRVYERDGCEDGYDFAYATLTALRVVKRLMRSWGGISDRDAQIAVLTAAAKYSN